VREERSLEMQSLLPARTDVLDGILDRVHPPVARFRVISNGLAPNHTLKSEDDISGTRACLSCGNCVDACPVVASKPEGTMFVRTSMLLENVVGEECRRCYQCVAACPQVSKPIKDYVRGFRRIERVSHWDLLASYLVLMLTGILINHWGSDLPPDLRDAAGILHRVFAVGLVAAPLILILLDRHHFLLSARRALSWSRRDGEWFGNTWRWVTNLGKRGAIKRGAYNPGQRFWYIYVPLAILVFAVTGGIRWLGPDVVGEQMVGNATVVHVTAAWMTDVLLVLHIYLKLGWPILRDTAAGARQFLDQRRRRRAAPLLGRHAQ
jgi:cytochrome b subunit of formate dehydrogenase